MRACVRCMLCVVVRLMRERFYLRVAFLYNIPAAIYGSRTVRRRALIIIIPGYSGPTSVRIYRYMTLKCAALFSIILIIQDIAAMPCEM